jgi:hypothetical protein
MLLPTPLSDEAISASAARAPPRRGRGRRTAVLHFTLPDLAIRIEAETEPLPAVALMLPFPPLLAKAVP